MLRPSLVLYASYILGPIYTPSNTPQTNKMEEPFAVNYYTTVAMLMLWT